MSQSQAQKKREELDELLDRYSQGMSTLQELFDGIRLVLEGYDPNAFMSQFTIVYAVQSITIVYHDGKVVRVSWTSKLEELSPTT